MTAATPSVSARRRYDVTIRGGGIVGQTLALLLARDRLKVALIDDRQGNKLAAPGPADV